MALISFCAVEKTGAQRREDTDKTDEFLRQESANFCVKDWKLNILGFASHATFVPAAWLCRCGTKTPHAP